MTDKQQIEKMAEAIERTGMLDSFSRCEVVAEELHADGYCKQREWISVDERLPTDERNVLCYYGFDRGDGDLGMMFIGVLSYFAFDPNPHFQHESMGLRVTHWMPLPEAPKGGVQE